MKRNRQPEPLVERDVIFPAAVKNGPSQVINAAMISRQKASTQIERFCHRCHCGVNEIMLM